MMPGSEIPNEVEIIERITDSPSVFTLRLRFTDSRVQRTYAFHPGQFNMLGLPGVGEVAISIVSDPEDEFALDHTVHAVGRVTKALARLQRGDRLGLRGPYGRGWPLTQAMSDDIVILTGGLGCAAAVSAIHYIANRRAYYGRLNIIQGVQRADDPLWRRRYDAWAELPDTYILLTSDHRDATATGHLGHVTGLVAQAQIDPQRTTAMVCGPELMMHDGILALQRRGVPEDSVYLNMERNVQCARGHCGHCQLGPHFICRDGPIFNYAELRPWFAKAGI